jgi:hypothetical protein
MSLDKTISAADANNVDSHEGVSRREFVARLRRTALFVAPAVVAIGLSAPKVSAGY